MPGMTLGSLLRASFMKKGDGCVMVVAGSAQDEAAHTSTRGRPP